MKTKEEINEQVIKIDNEINNRIKKVGFFDSDFVELFKRWQKKENKYLDFDIGKVEFEEKKLKEIADFPTLSRSSGIDITIDKFKKLDKTQQKEYFPLLSGTLNNNQIAGYIHKSKIKPEQLSRKYIISWSRLNPSNFFIHKTEVLISDDAFILQPKSNVAHITYLKHASSIRTREKKYGWGNKAGKRKIQNLEIPIPKSITINSKKYSSYDIQKIIVEFLEYQFNISKKYREQLQYIKEDIEEFEKGLLPAVFNKNNEYIKQMFIKWNTNPSVSRKKEEMVDFTLDDIEFEEKKIGELVDSRSGSSKYTKEYYKNNSGNYPLMTGALDIVAYVKPIDENDIIKEESISYNKDNDAGSTAFYHTKPYIVGGHHYALLVKGKYKNKIYVKYFYYTMKDFFNRNKFYQSRKPIANISLIKEKTIKIPKSIIVKTKEYSSYDIQRAIVSFIDRFYEWQEQVKLKIEKLNKLLDEIDEAILYKAFNLKVDV